MLVYYVRMHFSFHHMIRTIAVVMGVDTSLKYESETDCAKSMITSFSDICLFISIPKNNMIK